MSNIPVEYLYFKPKDVASMTIDVACDILMSEPDLNKDIVIQLMKDPQFLRKFEEISNLINKCGDDIAVYIKNK